MDQLKEKIGSFDSVLKKASKALLTLSGRGGKFETFFGSVADQLETAERNVLDVCGWMEDLICVPETTLTQKLRQVVFDKQARMLDPQNYETGIMAIRKAPEWGWQGVNGKWVELVKGFKDSTTTRSCRTCTSCSRSSATRRPSRRTPRR